MDNRYIIPLLVSGAAAGKFGTDCVIAAIQNDGLYWAISFGLFVISMVFTSIFFWGVKYGRHRDHRETGDSTGAGTGTVSNAKQDLGALYGAVGAKATITRARTGASTSTPDYAGKAVLSQDYESAPVAYKQLHLRMREEPVDPASGILRRVWYLESQAFTASDWVGSPPRNDFVCKARITANHPPVPVPECTCGIYAWRKLPARPNAPSVTVAVRLWGEILSGLTGFRAEHAIVDGISYPTCSTCWRRAIWLWTPNTVSGGFVPCCAMHLPFLSTMEGSPITEGTVAKLGQAYRVEDVYQQAFGLLPQEGLAPEPEPLVCSECGTVFYGQANCPNCYCPGRWEVDITQMGVGFSGGGRMILVEQEHAPPTMPVSDFLDFC